MIWGKIVKIKQLELSQKENPNTFFFFFTVNILSFRPRQIVK